MFACSAYISAVGINQFVPSYADIVYLEPFGRQFRDRWDTFPYG